MSTKLDERIKWIKESNYSDEWKESQIAGALRTAETLESRGYKEPISSGTEYPYPKPNPNDLPELQTTWRENEYEIN